MMKHYVSLMPGQGTIADMKEKRFLLFLMLALLAPMALQARKIAEKQAQQAAVAFLQKRHASTARAKSLSTPRLMELTRVEIENDACYLYNCSEGFVIASASDLAPAILGYSDKGCIDAGNIPEGLKAWMQQMEYETRRLTHKTTAGGDAGMAAVAPLIETEWGQLRPYNMSLNNCPTGCVATAMAQIMHYHRLPEGRMLKDLPNGYPATFFQWDRQKPRYEEDDMSDEAVEVARLMNYIGYAVNMNYGSTVSFAYHSDAAAAFVQYFGFSNTLRYIKRKSFGTAQWEQTIYNELREQRPVYMAGTAWGENGENSHAFVCDGYENNYFHINWGWDGTSNGYFLLSLLDPEEEGTGGAVGGNGYSMEQEAIIGLQKVTDHEKTLWDMESNTIVPLDETTWQRRSAGSGFEGTLLCWQTNDSPYDMNATLGIGLYKDAELTNILWQATASCTPYMTRGSKSAYVNLGALANGEYRIYNIFRAEGSDTWQLCENSDNVYIDVWVDGLSATLTPVGSAEGMPADYSVSGHSIDGKLQKGRTVEVKLGIRNAGRTQTQPMYLLVNNKVASAAGCYIEPGETGEMIFRPTLKVSGEARFVVCYDRFGNQPIYEWTENISPLPKDINLEFSNMRIDNLDTNRDEWDYSFGTPEYVGPCSFLNNRNPPVLNTTDVNMKVSIHNKASERYDCGILLYIVGTDSDGNGYVIDVLAKDVDIPAGQTSDVAYNYKNLEPGKTYKFRFYWNTYETYWFMLDSDGKQTYFIKISPDATSGINEAEDSRAGTYSIYNIYGIKQQTLRKGINIIESDNGTVKKVFVK